VITAICAVGLGAAATLLILRFRAGAPPAVGFSNSLVLDDLAAFLSLAIVAATGLLVAVAPVDIRRRHIDFGEYYGLLLLSAASMMFLVASNDFIMLFLNLEILSLAMYVLTGVTRLNPRSNEAAVKYLVTGAFATGFLLFGMALLYGATGTIRLDAIGVSLAAGNASPMLPVGVGLLLVGFGFKIGAVPFHMWVPDVYEGAPTTTTAFMSVTVKAAGVGALIRVLLIAVASRPDLWADLLWALAVLTMVVGNLLALRQNSVKRMLAFSSVAHTGYALVALATMQHSGPGPFSTVGASAAVFYLFVYTFMTLGAFMFLVYLGHQVTVPGRAPEWQDAEHIDDLAGLAERRPWAAFAMTIFMISLAGVPPTAGFFGKFYLFKAAVDQGHWVLAIIGVLASLVSLYYYLRVVVAMYMKDPGLTDETPDARAGLVVALTAAITLALGVQPTVFLDWAARSISLLR
jgi:NADH-quinone oxidoreductase subunit N